MKIHAWYQIRIRIDERYQDLLTGLLVLLGFTGFVQEGNTLTSIIPAQKWNAAFKIKFDSVLAKFKTEFPALDLSYSRSMVHEENWNRKWERQTGIVEATQNIVIKPSWKNLPKKYKKKTVLHIDPKMSFGTGHHETTRLSLSLLERFLAPNMLVLDFGTGTGVLAIACCKLGAKSICAVDNDEWSIENVRENIKKNKVQNLISVKQGSISVIPRRQFDLVVANINFRTISRFISPLAGRVQKQGIMILSGILTSDLPVLLNVFAHLGLVPVEVVNENEWTSIALRKM